MSTTSEHRREQRYVEVFEVIAGLEQFTSKEVQSRCIEAKPAFVTSLLRQLLKEGVLRELPSREPSTVLYSWSDDRNAFSSTTWISRQVIGTQVTQSPPEERPRERLLSLGADKLKTSELIAILIRSGRKGESAVQAGQRLVNHFPDRLHELRKCSPAELREISRAVSEVAFCQIMAGIELGRRVTESMQEHGLKLEKLSSTRSAIEYCERHFSRLVEDGCQEEFHIVTLDTKLQAISRHCITVGTLDASLVHPREVFRPAIKDSASAIVLVHNHPSGDPTPSNEDRSVTDRLKRAGELIGIHVLDHIVVAARGCVSLAERT